MRKRVYGHDRVDVLEPIAAARDIDATFRRRGDKYYRCRVERKLYRARGWILSDSPDAARQGAPKPEDFHEADSEASPSCTG
eukprot:12653874-Alexandrium_andersonii.AAC.1